MTNRKKPLENDVDRGPSFVTRKTMDRVLTHITRETLQRQLANARKELELVKARHALALIQEEWVLAKGLRKRRDLTINMMNGLMGSITRKVELETENDHKDTDPDNAE